MYEVSYISGFSLKLKSVDVIAKNEQDAVEKAFELEGHGFENRLVSVKYKKLINRPALETGMIVALRNNSVGIVFLNFIRGFDWCQPLVNYNGDLQCKSDKNLDIIGVYTAKNAEVPLGTLLDENTLEQYGKLCWCEPDMI